MERAPTAAPRSSGERPGAPIDHFEASTALAFRVACRSHSSICRRKRAALSSLRAFFVARLRHHAPCRARGTGSDLSWTVEGVGSRSMSMVTEYRNAAHESPIIRHRLKTDATLTVFCRTSAHHSATLEISTVCQISMVDLF